MKVYLSGPIYPDNKNETDTWRKRAYEYLKLAGIETLDPCRGKAVYTYGAFTPLEIVYRDLRDVDLSDLLLVNFNLLPNKLPIGTVMEIQHAFETQKPVVTVGNDPRVTMHPWIQAMAVRHFEELDEALEYIVNFWG